jgi:hypothetical protein
MRYRLWVLLALWLTGFCGNNPASPNQYLGSNSCKSCHQVEHQQWQTSDHHKTMQSPNAATVLGDFANKTVESHWLSSNSAQNRL